MSHPLVPWPSRPCVWMSAGVLHYKLCDRGFDCERCPLDAGLRGALRGSGGDEEPLRTPDEEAALFSNDRRYANGHSWVQEMGGASWHRMRFGLDAFAAALIGRCDGVRPQPPETTLAVGAMVSQIDLGLGTLPVGSPLHCVMVRGNPTLEARPEQLVTDPYGEGWIAEVIAIDPAEVDFLFDADEAREKARHDLQHFRHRVALHLLNDAEANHLGPTLPDGGELCVDLRRILGRQTYLALLRELIH